MNDNALDVTTGAPPGGLPGRVGEWRAVARVFRSPASAFSSTVCDLVTTVFPADCRACGGPLLHDDLSSASTPVCDSCLSQLLPQNQSLSTALCQCCGEALGMESGRFAIPKEGLLCTPCRTVPPAFQKAAAYGVYENELREMIHLLKYEGVHSLAKPLGARLAEAILTLEREPNWTGDVTAIGVPLFIANQHQRGFNQSILLADSALSTLRRLRPNWKMQSRHSLLQRIKSTESQFNLSTKGRRRNLIGAFKVADEDSSLIGRDVLLIDDIYTTGATSRACAQIMKRAGARHVWVATLARAQREHVAFWNRIEDEFG